MLKLKEREQTLALAGIFQATELVNQAATQGVWSGYAAEQSISSLFKLSANDVEDVYDGVYGVQLGLRTLTAMLGGQEDHMPALQYAASLLQLERRFRSKSAMQTTIGEQLQEIAGIPVTEDETGRLESQITALAELYQRTISTLQPRVVVRGKADYLQKERNLHWIRALLLSGLRSAVLWRQLGGSRWSLLLGRRRLLHAARELLHA